MHLIPSGTITFLFTDIEGSTQLWEKHPEAMKMSLARHDVILRQAIEAHGGHVFKTVGDAFCAAFPSAPDAISAALDAQRAISAESWDEATVIKVRMGLHSGAAEVRDNDYFGPTLNRVARLMSAGHGGQTLLSAMTRELVQASLPEDVALRDMGERGLKDLIRPEHIYQLTVPGLQTDFPPLKTLEAFRTNLPAQLTSFIGREKDISTVKSLMAGHHLVTLTGSGGTGKTRLSLQVAADSLDSFRDGVWFVEFAPLSNPALIPQTVLTTLGLREETGHSLLETLTHYLHTKKVLLILDNCEHLVEAAAQFAEAILRSCPNLRLLVSSREALGIPGEKAHHVRSLSIPKTDAPLSVETAVQYEAINLFVDRAKNVSSGFTITPSNIFAVAQICTRLDGIPLAIELAAARIKLLKAEQIAERLDDRFRLLTGGNRTALPRQQTLRAMIDWSYDLLPELERALLRRLSVFAGGWTLEAAEEICKSEIRSMNAPREENLSSLHAERSYFILHPSDVLDPLAQLVNKSLVVVDADEGAETRYHLLETVRQYAREKLIEASEGIAVRDLHLQYFLGLAEHAEPELIGSNMPEWLNRLEVEHDNFRAALEWSLKQNPQVGLQLAGTLYWFWQQMMYHDEGIEWLKKLLATEGSKFIHLAIKAKALNAAGWLIAALMAKGGIRDDAKLALALSDESLALFKQLGDKQGMAFALRSLLTVYGYSQSPNYEMCQALANESLALFRELGNKYGIAEMTGFLAGLALLQGNLDQAEALYDEALPIKKELGNLGDVAWDLSMLAGVAAHRGNHERTKALFEESYSIYRELGIKNKRYKWWTINPANNLAECMLLESAYGQAAALMEENLALCREIGSAENSRFSWSLLLLGNALLGLGNYQQATELLKESLGLCQTMGHQRGIADVLQTLAGVAAAQKQPERAARLFGTADAVFETIQVKPAPYQRAQRERDIAIVSAQLDEATFAAAQSAGRAMSMDKAIAYALESTHD